MKPHYNEAYKKGTLTPFVRHTTFVRFWDFQPNSRKTEKPDGGAGGG